jgi:hypothetical protein
LWDTAFTVQAIFATSLEEEFHETLKLAHDYIKRSQVNKKNASTLYSICATLITPVQLLNMSICCFSRFVWTALETKPNGIAIYVKVDGRNQLLMKGGLYQTVLQKH